MKRIWVGLILISLALLILSCNNNKKKNNTDEEIFSIDIKESEIDFEIEKNQTWHTENEKIIVVFGYGFNDEAFISESKSLLNEKFGLAENGGRIIPIVFPNDFRHKEKAVTVDLFNIIDDNTIDLKGLVLLGAPENSYRALAKMQDAWNGEIPYPVFTLFPQDDVLGIEDTSDIVIDKLQKAELETSLTEESEQQNISDAEDILIKTVQYLLYTETGPAKDERISTHVKQMLPNKTVRRYIDSETGLSALNHFVIE